MDAVYQNVCSDIPQVDCIGLELIEKTERIANIADPHLPVFYAQDTMCFKRGMGRVLLEDVDFFSDELLHRF